MLQRALERDYLQAGCVAQGRRLSGCRRPSLPPPLRDGLATIGPRYVQDDPAGFGCGRRDLRAPARHTRAGGVSSKPGWWASIGAPRRGAAMSCRRSPGARSRWPEGCQGPRSHLFSALRVRPTSRRKPGEIHWSAYRWTAASPATNGPRLRKIPRCGVGRRIPVACRNGVRDGEERRGPG